MFPTHFRSCLGLLGLLIAAAGCGGKGATVPLHGIVKLDGRPLANATVLFLAQDPPKRDATAHTDADGVFRLSSFKPDDGAYPGRYKVVVQPPTPDTGVGVTPRRVQIRTAGSGRTSTGPPLTIPPRYSQPDQTSLVQNVPASGNVVFELQSK